METIQDILNHKGSAVVSASKDTTVLDAAQRMLECNIGALVIVDDAEKIIGIISERDIVHKVIAAGLNPARTRVGEIMTSEIVNSHPETSLKEARRLIMLRRVRHLPVLNNERKLVGMVSIGDLNAQLASEQEQTIHLLWEYIGVKVASDNPEPHPSVA